MTRTTAQWWRDLPRPQDRRINPPISLVELDLAKAEDQVLATLDKAIAEMEPMQRELKKRLELATLYGMSAGRIFYDEAHNTHFEGLASRYWPATSEVHQHMSDLTLSPAPKGGYTVTSYEDDVLFAGTLDACTTFMAEQMEELEDRKATAEIEATAKRKKYEAEKLVAAEASRIRAEAEKQIAALHVVPSVLSQPTGTGTFKD